MVDGVAGIGLALILFDMTPEPPKLRKKPFNPDPIPDGKTLLVDALWDSAIESVDHWTRFQKSVTDFGAASDNGDLSLALRKFGQTLGSLLLPLARMPFNKPLNGRRLVVWRSYSFTDARAVRAVAGGTFNDVILTAIGGAVRKYLIMKNRDPKKMPRTLRILVPVNVRQEHERGALGNRISFLPVEVPLHIEDPIERLQAVHLRTRELKEARVSTTVGLMFEAMQGLPAQLQAAALGAVANPSLQALLPTGMPVVLEMGINFAIASYDQRMFVNICADGVTANDAEKMGEFLDASFEELLAAAEVKQADYVRIRASAAEAAY
jgi:hypothetical protein